MRVCLDPSLEPILRAIGRAADDGGAHAWVVGGVLRDALIDAPVTDIDISIVGDVESVVRRLRIEWNAEVEQHDAFSTATLISPGMPRVDVVRARKETYSRPGALPDVVPSGIADDIERRDFTVNAIAADLGEAGFGELLDPFSGQTDFDCRILRILHAGSFVDDPTRLFRAARYAVRFDLEPDAETDAEAESAVRGGALGTISADRRRREVELILSEPRWADALVWLNRWRVWESLAEGWAPASSTLKRADVVRAWALRALAEAIPAAADLRWLTLLASAPAGISGALSVKAAELRLVGSVRGVLASLQEADGPRWWRAMDSETLAILLTATALCGSDSEKARLTRYIGDIRNVGLDITGDDLVARGIPPGRPIGGALAETLDAVREGRIAGRAAELDYAMTYVRQGMDHS